MQERVQKILSQWGIASRRQAEHLISSGRVRLNGAVAELGQKADPVHDRLEVDGQPIQPHDRPAFIYLLLNKPVGIVSTCDDPQNRRTVLDLLPEDLQQGKGLHPVGRLDVESTGAILLTNDGELTNYLTHPRHHISKTYEVWVNGEVSLKVLQQWREGVMLDGRKTLPAVIEVLRQLPDRTLLSIVIREGRNRQIRRVAQQLGHPVIQLHRSAIGPIKLRSSEAALLPGQYRPLQQSEIRALKQGLNTASVRLPAVKEWSR